MLHLGCAITISVADGGNRSKRVAEIVLSLYIRAKIETSDIDALFKLQASAKRRIHRQTL